LPYGEIRHVTNDAVHIIPCTAYTPDGGGAVGTGVARTGVIAPGDPYQKTSPSSTRGMFSSLAAVTGTIACWSDPRSPTKVWQRTPIGTLSSSFLSSCLVMMVELAMLIEIGDRGFPSQRRY
jgi:hypothetical protein